MYIILTVFVLAIGYITYDTIKISKQEKNGLNKKSNKRRLKSKQKSKSDTKVSSNKTQSKSKYRGTKKKIKK